MGRPKTLISAAERRSTYTLESHPTWLSYADIQHLLRLYMGKGYGKATWNTLVATGKIPGYQDPFNDRNTRYKWDEVRAAIDAAMKRVG